MTIGVLAFHGDFAEHIALLRSMEQEAIEVRSVDNLALIDHLIIPGGESTVMSDFLRSTGVGDAIVKRVKQGNLAVYGTCAGAILLARKITGKNSPSSLGLMDIAVQRNAYGTQLQSFSDELTIKGMKGTVTAAFIRAPIITGMGKGVETLAEHNGHPALVRQGKLLAGTFHPEVRGQKHVHQMFLMM